MSNTTELTAAEKLISLENLARYDTNNKEYIQKKLNDVSGAVVDTELSETSENAVQNKVVTDALNNKVNKDEIPTSLPANGGNATTAQRASELASVTSDVCLRNIYATTTDLEAGVSALETGAICLVYE